MTTEEFWHGDARLCVAYRNADRLRTRRNDMLAWMYGGYTYEAIGALTPVLNPFSKRYKAEKYTEMPHIEQARREKERKTIQQDEREEEMEMLRWLAQVDRRMKGADSQDGNR